MENIISKIAELLKDTKSLIDFEEQFNIFMQEVFTQLVGDVFVKLDRMITEQKLEEGWEYCRRDGRSIQFLFGNVYFKRTLMHDRGEIRIILWMNG